MVIVVPQVKLESNSISIISDGHVGRIRKMSKTVFRKKWFDQPLRPKLRRTILKSIA